MTDFVPSEIFVMRTPLLPMEELEAWNAGLRAPHASEDALDEALAHDRALLRARLEAQLARPEIAEALFLASPDLAASLEQWRRDPDSKKGRRTEQGLVRYFVRMASRPTPFGLFSGCTSGRVGAGTHFAMAPLRDYRRTSRLDMDYLFALCEQLTRDPQLRAELTFRPNSSLHEAAGRLRFAESRVRGSLRTYHLVAFDAFDALRQTLARAAGGARLDELAAALVDEEITREDADAFVNDLVDNQLLVPDLALPVTGERGLLDQLRPLTSGAAAASAAGISRAEAALASIDASPIGLSPDRYVSIARELEPLGVPIELSKLFQVDLTKPGARMTLGASDVAEVLRGIEIFHRFSRARHDRSLEEFRNAFTERYGS
ncbi:MAG TPA: lantibiotic dehydratase, partial [Thermoanaerobaculia bacterium]|nr:lantibiotic dehydratase [Thermoanaerobaculia bacterium]